MRCRLRAGLRRIYRADLSVNDEVVDAVLDERRAVLSAEQPLGVGFVFGKQPRWLAIAIKIAIAQVSRIRMNDRTAADGLQRWSRIVLSPGPTVSEPERGKQVKISGFGAPIVDVDLNQDVLG